MSDSEDIPDDLESVVDRLAKETRVHATLYGLGIGLGIGIVILAGQYVLNAASIYKDAQI